MAPTLGQLVIGMISSEVDPMFVDLTANWRIVAFGAALGVSTCVLFGLAPALARHAHAAGRRHQGIGSHRDGGRAQALLRRVLVTTQVALSLSLLVMGLLFARSLFNLLTIDAGFEQRGILEADVDLSGLKLPDDGLRAFRSDLRARLRAIPGVEAAASASAIPLAGRRYENVFLEGPEGRRKEIAYSNEVSAEYFETLGTALLAGRDFEDGDTPSSPGVVIVNQAFVSRILRWHDTSRRDLPPGRRIRRARPDRSSRRHRRRTRKYGNLREEFKPIVYLADSQQERQPTFDSMLIRLPMTPAALMPHVTRALEAAHADLSFHFHDFQEQIRYSILQDRLMATLCGFFAILAAVLAVVGVYRRHVVSVTERTVEIGIRLALGAARRSIAALILREALLLLATGLLLGLALRWASGGPPARCSSLCSQRSRHTGGRLCAADDCGMCRQLTSQPDVRRRTDPLVTLRNE